MILCWKFVIFHYVPMWFTLWIKAIIQQDKNKLTQSLTTNESFFVSGTKGDCMVGALREVLKVSNEPQIRSTEPLQMVASQSCHWKQKECRSFLKENKHENVSDFPQCSRVPLTSLIDIHWCGLMSKLVFVIFLVFWEYTQCTCVL